MNHIVSITRQGQLTIPRTLRQAFGIHGATKALVKKVGSAIVVRPTADFWSLSGSLKSRKRLNSQQLKAARRAFARQWPRER